MANGHQDTYSNKAIKSANHISQQVWHSKVSVEKIKPPYCESCDKYYCSEMDLQYHTTIEHDYEYILNI